MLRRAIAVAWAARRRAAPNPWVGAVLVARDGQQFTGATEPPGSRHAEVVALDAAGVAGSAEGSVLYVTLEPCSHHGRTPPCTDAIVAAGVARVVVGIEDPDPRVAGQGIAALEAAGIEVVVGIEAAAVNAQLRPYLHHRRTGRPEVVLKLAASLDGRIAAPDGTSQWITSAAARRDAHQLRADAGAILVGAGTVRADDPALTVRLEGYDGPQPRRIVLGRAPRGAKVHPCEEHVGPIGPLLDRLGAEGVLQVLVEGGATVAHGLVAEGLVDRLVCYLAPAIFGGDDARGMFAGRGAATIEAIRRGQFVSAEQIGDDLRVEVVPK